MIKWATLLHIYQPPHWKKEVILKVARESYRPILNILKKQKKFKITLNINGSLTEQLAQLKLNDIIADIKLLAKKGQIEFTGSAKYHVILPKLPFSEIIRQIRLNTKTNKKFFGQLYQPRGFFSPEMCYNNFLAKIVAKEKFQWIALDEIAYNGKLQKVDWQQGYKIKDLPLKVIFRNRIISDWFLGKPLAEVKKSFKNLKDIPDPLILAMDGETLGHHRRGMDKVFAELISKKEVEPVTYSELVRSYKNYKQISPLASSWASSEEELKRGIPYELWDHPKNPIHELQWQLFYLVLNTILKSKKDSNFKKARILLDENLNSDPFWWASAHPWWSAEIISQGANNLLTTLKTIKNLSARKIRKAELLIQQINNLAQKWQESGKALQERKSFLKKSNAVMHLGGEKVK